MRKFGFTLIELLVAITILAIISIIGYQTLFTIINTEQNLKLRDKKLNQIQIAYNQWQADCINLEKNNIKNIANNLQITTNEGKINAILMIRYNAQTSSWQLISYKKYQHNWLRIAFDPTDNSYELIRQLNSINKLDMNNSSEQNASYNMVNLLPIDDFNLKIWQQKAWTDYLLINPQEEVKGLQLNLTMPSDWQNIGNQQFNCLVKL